MTARAQKIDWKFGWKFGAAIVASVFVSLSVVHAADNSALIQELEAGAIASGSDRLTIIENGQTIYDNDFGKETKIQSVQSVTKSVCAIAIGILLDRGLIPSVDEPMTTWIPEWKNHPEKSKITLKHLMNHTSGFPNNNAISDAENRIEFAINHDLVAKPGEKFIYSGVATALLQHVISKSAGMTLEKFVDENIFLPLGITERSWYKDKLGHEATGGGLSLKQTDLAKLGLMMLGGGVYKGKRILSEKSQALLLARSQGFEPCALLWWLTLPKTEGSNDFRVYYAAGWGGQYIVVFPEKNLVAVRTRDPQTVDDAKEEEQSFWDFPDIVARWQ